MPIRFSLGLIAAFFFAFRLFFAHLDVDPQAINILKRWVSSEYVRYQTSRDDSGMNISGYLEIYAHRNIRLRHRGVVCCVSLISE